MQRVESGENAFLKSVPDAGLVPVTEPAPAGHPTPAAHLLGQVFPLNAGLQNEDDASEAGAVGDRRPPTLRTRGMEREQRLDQAPEFVRNKGRSHAGHASQGPMRLEIPTHISAAGSSTRVGR